MITKKDSNPVVLITGASSGIGEAAAKRMIEAKWTVYAGARRVERMKVLAEAGAIPVALDVTDDASMVATIDQILQSHGRIDGLVNNAGYGSYGSVEDVSMDEARRQVEVNLMGLARLSQLVLPTMREAHRGRIVNVTSIGGKIGEPLGGWYHATKFAVEGLSDCMRMELRRFGIDVVVVEPGGVATEWSDIAAQNLIDASRNSVYSEEAKLHAAMFTNPKFTASLAKPELIANVIHRSLTDVKPKTRYVAGYGAKPLLFLRHWLSDRAFDRAMSTLPKLLTSQSTS